MPSTRIPAICVAILGLALVFSPPSRAQEGVAPVSGAASQVDPALDRESSLRGFVSVEPFEVRLEALVPVAAFRSSWNLVGATVNPGSRQAILDNVATLLESGVTLQRGSGKEITFSGREARFVQRDPETGYVTDPRDAIPIDEALVGVTFFSEEVAVEELTIEWLWYAPGQDRTVVEITSRGKPSARFATRENSTIRWELDGNPGLPKLLFVPSVDRTEERPLGFLLYVAAGFGLAALGVILLKQRDAPSWVGTLVVLAIILAILGFSVRTAEVATPEPEVLDEITYRTLRNIYHAFDFRNESAIYDTLEKSVTGPLLETIYLEVRQSLELESSGGPRVKVYEIALRDAESLGPGDSSLDSIRVDSNWVTVGEVSHWGHTHERTNRYEALLEFAAVDTDWKLIDFELKNEERVQRISRNRVAPILESPETEPGPVEEDREGEDSSR